MSPKSVTPNIIKVNNQRVQWLQQCDKHLWVVRIGRTYEMKLIEKNQKLKSNDSIHEFRTAFLSCSQYKETIRPGLPVSYSSALCWTYIHFKWYLFLSPGLYSKSQPHSNEGNAFAFLSDKKAHGNGQFVVYHNHRYYYWVWNSLGIYLDLYGKLRTLNDQR